MPTFMESLAENPTNSKNPSGIYGQPQQTSDQDVLNVVNKLKDREMQDFQNKANFMSDLSLRQEQRMRNLYDPSKHLNPQDMPTTMIQDPNMITEPQRAELGIRQQGLNLESQRLAQTGKLGQEAIDIRSRQEKLNQQKADQANTAKQADMERKINESNQKIELAQQALQQKGDNAAAQLQAHKDLAAAVEERHKLELENKQHQFDITSEQHQKAIDALQERLKQSAKTTTTTDQGGETRTVTTERGDNPPPGKVWGVGRDGNRYPVPVDKIDDWNANHAAPGTEIKKGG